MFTTKNQNNLHRLTLGVASVLLGAALVGGTATTANADTATAPVGNYTLPVANDQGSVVEQHITQNVTRTVNVTNPQGQTTTTTQVATLQGNQRYDQTHGVVLEGHLNNGKWASVNVPAVNGYKANAKVPATVVTAGTHDQTINVNYVKNVLNDGNGQAAKTTTPAAVAENENAIEMTPTETQATKKDETTPAADHVAGASVGLAGLVAMIAGLAGWKKHEN